MKTQYLECTSLGVFKRTIFDCGKQESFFPELNDSLPLETFLPVYPHNSSYTSYGSTVISINNFFLASSRIWLRPSQASLNRLHEFEELKWSSKY